ncbi:Cation/multidrug efflux pump [Rhodovulum sp. P5]|uniref:hypothetical protein n=1 Tax=Rhodovulum sp. P5 TaxID=1564506 RepID=UPI0009C32439|nr:hypothetical protein [Rhodovulum sp. P5]ARE41861.1 Cation/multidrug efflux pump [Rhodovulum sp. P5]
MFAFLRFAVIGFVILSVIYVALSLYSRAVRRAKLKREWEDEIGYGDRDVYVREGLEDYDSSLRRKLILGVYVVPVAVIGTIIYITNYM